MDTRFLQSLIVVVEQGSIAAAARALNLTAAAVSQRIQSLETELNCQLLDRSSHKASPTRHAYQLLPRARHIVQQSLALAGDIDPQGLSGALRIGAVDSVLSSLFAPALAQFTQQAPNARCTIVPGTSASLFTDLVQQKIDIAICVQPSFTLPKNLACSRVYSKPFALISAKTITGTLKQVLSAQPYIRYDPHAWGGRQIDNFLQQQAINTTVIADLDALSSIAQMVNAGLGVSVIPLWPGIQQQLPKLQIMPLTEPALQRSIVALHPYYPERPKLIEILINILRENSSASGSIDASHNDPVKP